MPVFKLLISMLFFLLLHVTQVQAAKLLIAVQTTEAGSPTTSLRVSVKDAPDLAGLKFVFEFNRNNYTYKEFDKSATTESMLHVVNDKYPGKLIVVMASATGQPTPDAELFTLRFSQIVSTLKPADLGFKVSKTELMSAHLAQIPCTETVITID